MKLFLSGQEFKFKRVPPAIARVTSFLEKSSDGELFTLPQVADALNMHVKTIENNMRFISAYVSPGGHGNIRYYGKPATIKELKRQLAKEKNEHHRSGNAKAKR